MHNEKNLNCKQKNSRKFILFFVLSIFVAFGVILSNAEAQTKALETGENTKSETVESTRTRPLYQGNPKDKSITPKLYDAVPRKSEFGNTLYVGKYADELQKNKEKDKFKDPRGSAYSSDDLEPDDDL